MNARKKSLQRPLDTVSQNRPPDRINELERRVAELEKEVAVFKRLGGWPPFGEETKPAEKKKPGIEKKIADEVLFHYRDGLILWLEPIWPWMVERLLAAGTAEGIRAVLEAVAEEPDLRPEWQKRLLQNPAVLLEFIWDERFRKTLPKTTVSDALTLPWDDTRRRRAANQFPTRQITNAMVGVPDIAWRTSLDRCFEQPSTMFVALNLDMYYRDLYDIPAPENRDLTGVSCPVPKPLQPVLARSGEGTNK